MNYIQKNKIIGLWGFGRMGKSAVNYLHAQGYSMSILDKRNPTAQENSYLQEKKIRWYIQDQEDEAFFYSCDYIISSPGINISQLCYATYREKWISELDFFYTHFHKPIIAITGSIGKTSVTHILAQLCKELSIPVAVGGNIGTPTFDLIQHQDRVAYALLEVSSFQLMRCTAFAPMLAVWTNFYPNHLDYHATEEKYFWAKYTMLKYQKNNSVSLIPYTLRDKVASSTQQIRAYFAAHKPQRLPTLHDNEQIYYVENNVIIRYAQKIATPLIMLTPELRNLSFIDNIITLVGICDLMKFNAHALSSITDTITLPEHRIEKIGSINNVTFYNDSKGTTTISTLAAVEKLKHNPLHLFLGGLSKGVDRTSFIAQLKHQVKHIYCFGKEAHTLHEMCVKNEISATHHTNLNSAVDTCITNIESGDCVLLSPAGSSFDLYENYEHRGNHFKELIKERLPGLV